MSSNVGLSTPRGSGTSGYVQRNSAFMKPRNAGYGAPYPPVSGSADRSFRQRAPDKQILEHDRRREIEVKVMEERERLEEENERVEEEMGRKGRGERKGSLGSKGRGKDGDGKGEGEAEEGEEREKGVEVDVPGRVLSEEEIDERCEALRARLLREMEDGGSGSGRGKMAPPGKDRRQLKAYQVHELAEAKIEESERLRRALGIREDRETGEISSGRVERRGKD